MVHDLVCMCMYAETYVSDQVTDLDLSYIKLLFRVVLLVYDRSVVFCLDASVG